jgi:uncharacterized membrane protein
MNLTLHIAAIALSLIGAVNSLYFILAQYGGARASCEAEMGACNTVLETPYARVFGIPNSVIGLLFYALVVVVCVVSRRTGSKVLLLYGLAASVMALPVSLYLAYALVYRLRRPCRLCFLSHAINLALVVLFAAMLGKWD